MQTSHRKLVERFEELRRNRGEHPLYFLEHGLDPHEVEELVEQVSAACTIHALSSPIWQSRYFPLLVVATEVGYTYRGTGTDFWPKLEERIATTVPPPDRRALSELFQAAAARHGGITPPDTAWAKMFNHIAWPITHAVLPLEFHRPFAQALATLRQDRIDPTDDGTLFQAVRRAAMNRSGVRFESVLADRDLILTLSRHFLGVCSEKEALTSQVLRRISHDLRKDRDAARDVELAYRQRRQAEAKRVENVGSEPGIDRSPLTGTLYLRADKTSGIKLEAALPALPPEIVARVRTDLRRRRFAPRLWGVSGRVASDNLISGLPFPVTKCESLGGLAGPLLPELDGLQVDGTLKAQLHRLHLDLTPPLLFQERASEPIAAQVRGGVATVDRIYWLLTASDVVGSGLEVLGALGDMMCVRVDPSEQAGRDMLEGAGIRIRFGTSARSVGDPPAHVDTEVQDYRMNDIIVIELDRVPPDGAVLSQAEETIQVTQSDHGLVRLANRPGTHSVRVSAEGRIQQIRYKIEADAPDYELCWISLEGEEPSVQTLLGRACALRVDGIAPLDGLHLNLSLISGDCSATASKRLSPLPAVIGPTDPIWDRLISDRTRDALRTQPLIQLRAVIGGIAAQEWRLEPRLRPCWWEGDDENPRLMTEEGEVPHGVVLPESPTAAPAALLANDGEGKLFVPIPADVEQLDPVAEFTGRFVTPTVLNLRSPQLRRPRLLRQRSSSESGLGAEQLIAALLRWKLADAVGPIADLRRRQIAAELEKWTVRMICGDTWAAAEDAIETQVPSTWAFFVAQCKAAGVGYDNYVELAPADEEAIGRFAVRQLQLAIPDLWLDTLGPPRADSICEELDRAFGRAYELLAREHRDAGRLEVATRLEEADPGSSTDQWNAVLFAAQSAAELRGLAELVYPTTGGDELVALDYSQMSINDLVDELQGWVRRQRSALQGRLWERDELEAALSLWLNPERALQTAWRSASERFITDRWTSRAARYMALRRRASLLTSAA